MDFTEQFQWQMFLLEHEEESDFYLSPCQSSDSPTPLLILRPFLFATAIGITTYSQVTYIQNGWYNWWYIYLTHWGLITVIFTTALAVIVSLKAQISGEISDDDRLAWYVKVYWVLYNIAKPLSILITVFFWTVLYKKGDSIPLAVCGHGINAVVTLTLLFSSRQPSRMLHFIHPFLFAVTWACFSAIHYLTKSTNTEGHRYVYPVVDWSKPLVTSGVVTATALLLGVFHFLVVGLAQLRDWIRFKIE